MYTHVGSQRTIERTLFDLRPGVTEMYLHPAIDTDELRVSHPDWAQRVEDHAYLTTRRVVARPGRTIGRDPHRLPRAARAATAHAAPLRDAHAGGTDRPVHARDARRSGSRSTSSTHVCFGPGDEIIGDDDGAIAFTFKEYGEHRSAWLVLVAVRPERQGAGRRHRVGARRARRRAGARRARPRTSRAPSRATSGPASTSRTPAPACCSRRSASSAIWSASTWRSRPASGAIRRRASVVERETGIGRSRLRGARVSALGRRARPWPSNAAPPSRRATPTARRSDSAATRATAPAGSARWRPIRTRSTAASARPSSPRSAPTSTRAARDGRDRVGQQPALLRQVRRDRVARLPGRPSRPDLNTARR